MVFEGIDGAGTSTQLIKLIEFMENKDKYQDVLRTHEPWKNKEINKRLQEDKDAYSGAEEMTQLYVGDRIVHTLNIINPNLNKGVFVFCDRYSLSTCTYQSTQGAELEKLLEMHRNTSILVPDITLFIDVSAKIARERITARGGSLEKFENDVDFVERLIVSYRKLVYNTSLKDVFGYVVPIDGEQTIEGVAEDIKKQFLPIYKIWERS